jgi:signal transduction histidine kinase
MLRGYLKGLERGVAETPEKVAHYVAMSIEKADALERLIADLFAYTRIDRPEQQPDWQPVDLGALLRNEVEGVASLATSRGITLETDGPDGPCMVLGDKHLLARSIVNLLDNALRYAGDGGTVQVHWQRKGGEVVFSVEDSGPGIDPQDVPSIFTPLYRGKASHARSGGAGLGLAISQRVLRAHGGDLVATNAPVRGAILTGTLPVGRHVDPPMTPQASAVGLGT